jgi:hypothetical protein
MIGRFLTVLVAVCAVIFIVAEFMVLTPPICREGFVPTLTGPRHLWACVQGYNP